MNNQSTVTDVGIATLGMLAESALLQTVHLTLPSAHNHTWGVPFLAEALRTAPSMTSLSLAFCNHTPSKSLPEALSAIHTAPALTSFNLCLNYSEVGDRGAQMLAAFRAAPVLKSLTLRLKHNNIGSQGAQVPVVISLSGSCGGVQLGTTPTLRFSN